jgi:hypothetical protein
VGSKQTEKRLEKQSGETDNVIHAEREREKQTSKRK